MTKINLKLSLLSFTAITLLTGCGTALNLTKYTPTTMNKAENMPSSKKMMSNNLPKVIIMDIDNNSIKVANQSKVGSTIATKVNTLLSDGKSVKIVKRVTKISYDKMLSKEVAAAQLSKELGTDVGQVDNIITGQISTASYDHSFAEGYYYVVKTKSGNERRYQPPMMSYKSCVVGNIKIFTLPSLDEAASFEYDECSSKTTEVRSANDVVSRNDGLVRSAALEGADTVSYSLKNFFSKKGYIYESRLNGDDKIIKTTLGAKDGAKDGETVEIYAVEDSTNNLTGVTNKETTLIATGTISNQVTPGSSWIIVDEVQSGKKIDAGDFVKIKYKEGIFSKSLKFFR
jgi:hypothetical protein